MDIQTTDHKWGEKRLPGGAQNQLQEDKSNFIEVCWGGRTRFQPTPGPGPPASGHRSFSISCDSPLLFQSLNQRLQTHSVKWTPPILFSFYNGF